MVEAEAPYVASEGARTYYRLVFAAERLRVNDRWQCADETGMADKCFLIGGRKGVLQFVDNCVSRKLTTGFNPL